MTYTGEAHYHVFMKRFLPIDKKAGFTPVLILIIIALILVGGSFLLFEFFANQAESERSDELRQEFLREQSDKELLTPIATKSCFNQNIFWNWSMGGKNGKAQIYFGHNNTSSVGTLLDEAGKKGVYTFSIESDGKASLGIIESDAKVYANATIGCDTVTFSIKGACSQSCNLDIDNPEYLKKVKIDPGSLGFESTLVIKQ